LTHPDLGAGNGVNSTRIRFLYILYHSGRPWDKTNMATWSREMR